MVPLDTAAKVPRLDDSNAPNMMTTENGNAQPPKPKTPRIKDPNKPKSRSQSEQPASCPICGAVIRQSRNLRRHLELRHFSKPNIKKERKSEFGNKV